MTFWNSKMIKDQLDTVIRSLDKEGEPVHKKHIKEAAYELSLGPEAYVSGTNEKTILRPGGMVAIAPGQIAVLLTEEHVEVPKDVLGFISLKSTVKIPGLINVSGFHVDPGFKGRLVFTVYNAGTETCAFTRGQKMFLIWFAQLEHPGEEEDHKGNRQNLKSIPGNDITRLTAEGASPAKLNERLQKMEQLAKIYGALLLAFFLIAATMFIREAVTNPKDSSSTMNQMQQSSPKDPENGQHQTDAKITNTSNDPKPRSLVSKEE